VGVRFTRSSKAQSASEESACTTLEHFALRHWAKETLEVIMTKKAQETWIGSAGHH